MIKKTYSGKVVLITGHTGFKGSWLCAWLKLLGADVVGLALDPPTSPSHFEAGGLATGIRDIRVDVRDHEAVERAVISAQPDFVFHLAAQALVRKSYAEPILTWQTNLLGTLHVLEALRKIDKACSAVIITSDKCYDNVEWVWGYREIDQVGGPDPYSASKGAAELAIKSHVKSYFRPGESRVRVASARAGNVIGGGDWAGDRIVPDCVRAWAAGSPVTLRNPNSTRPWQHVLEPLGGYLCLGAELSRRPDLHGEPFNFGPGSHMNHTVLDLVKAMAMHWDQVRWTVDPDVARVLYESNLLKLNCDKALHELSWHAVMGFEDTVRLTAEWYRTFYAQPTERAEHSQGQIALYTEMARKQQLPWAL